MNELPTAAILTLTGTGLAAARDITATGATALGIDDDRWRPARHSRHLTRIPELSDLPLNDTLVERLRSWAARLPVPPVLLPCSDAACEWVIKHKKTLDLFCRVSPGYVDDETGVMLDKLRFAERCEALGVDVPLSLVPRDHADIDAFIAQAGLPCIVKPREGHRWRQRLRGQKLLVPKTRDELLRWLDDIIGDPTAVVLQELIPGEESELVVGATLFGLDGSPRHVVTGRKIRQFPRNFGSGSLVISEHLPEVVKLSEKIVGDLGYHGICGTEFKRDPRNGRLRLIEINPRPTLWFDLCRAAGSHIIQAHWAELGGLPAVPIADQRQGVVWRYWSRDLIALAQAHGRHPLRLARALTSSPRAHTHATMALDDPRSIVATLAHTTMQALEHLRG